MPAALAALLRKAGHDVKTVPEENLAGMDDPRIISAATQKGRILITLDSDFGDIRNYPIQTHAGIVVFRLVDQRWAHLKEPAQRLIETRLLRGYRVGSPLSMETESEFGPAKRDKTNKRDTHFIDQSKYFEACTAKCKPPLPRCPAS